MSRYLFLSIPPIEINIINKWNVLPRFLSNIHQTNALLVTSDQKILVWGNCFIAFFFLYYVPIINQSCPTATKAFVGFLREAFIFRFPLYWRTTPIKSITCNCNYFHSKTNTSKSHGLCIKIVLSILLLFSLEIVCGISLIH